MVAYIMLNGVNFLVTSFLLRKDVIYMETRQKKGLFTITTRDLVIVALFAALSVVLTRFASLMTPDNAVRVGIGSVPLVYVGMMFGPLSGGLAGLVADLVGCLINPMGGTFFVGFTLSSVLTGVIPGLWVWLYKKKNLTSVVMVHLMIYVVISLGLDTLWFKILYGKSFLALLPLRALWHGILTILKIGLAYGLIKATARLIPGTNKR
jgi:ECF transporter S component (folate family)